MENILRLECSKVVKEMKNVRVTQIMIEETIVMKHHKIALQSRRDERRVGVIFNVETV